MGVGEFRVRTNGVVGVVVFIAAGVVGCAQLKSVFLPPPPQIPPAKKEAISPSPSTPAPPPAAPAAPAAPAPVTTAPVPTPPPAPPPATKAPAPVPPTTAPAPVPPTTKEQTPPPPSPPPAVLSPQVGRADEDRLKRESSGRIQKAEEIIKQIDQKKLKKDQQDTFSTIQSFLVNAKEAMTAQDFLRAFNLADKAQILAEELFRAIQ
jgi:hypothetical protein